MKIALQKLRTLDLVQTNKISSPQFVSAASGLVIDGHKFHVIADDELYLATFNFDGSLGTLTALFSGTLPADHKERKKQKPDLESLIIFDEGLLAIPSGSTTLRAKGVWLKNKCLQLVDFSQIYQHLKQKIKELNIEGCVIRKNEFILFQRGNGKNNENALIFLDYLMVKTAITSGQPIPEKSLCEIKLFELGSLNQVPLSFTDAVLGLNGCIWFIAAAENSGSTYLDGEYVGAILGCIDHKNNITYKNELDCPSKPEGLALVLENSQFWIVTDADNSEQPAELFCGNIPTNYF